jgi:hypothetical protein
MLRLTALENGERDRPGRPAARPAQQLFPGMWLALAASDVQRSAALGNAPGAAASQGKRPIQGARVLSSQTQRAEVLGESAGAAVEPALLWRRGARPSRSPCCASRTAASPAARLPLAPSDVQRSAALGKRPSRSSFTKSPREGTRHNRI